MAIVKLLARIVRRIGVNTACGVLALCLPWSPVAAETQYRLAAGDIMEISVAGIPELQRRVPIDMDGAISFPLLGTVVVAGLAPSQAQGKIQALLANKVYQMQTANGQSNAVVISPEQVTAIVAEYRPIYVNGDVSKPGAYPYRLSMTARQAIALAGGYDTMRFRLSDPVLDLADLKTEYETLWIEFANDRAHVWRLKSELGKARNPEQKALAGVPLPDSEVSDIIRREAALMNADQTDRQRQKEFFERAIKQGSNQIATLSEQQQAEEQGSQSDAEELQKDLDLLNKGMLVNQRVTDARRAVLLSSTRKLQTAVQLMQLEKQQSELQWKLEELDDRRQIELLGELQDAKAKLNEISAKLHGVEDKIQYTGLLRSQLARGGPAPPEIVIIRRGEKASRRLAATEDSELQPGDVIEVTLRRGSGPAATQ
jgi:polysaccharide export outer membrane protein